MQVEVDPTEDTEWNDILRAKGIIPERPPSPTQQLEDALQEAVQKAHDNRLENKNFDELEELEDEEDEDFLNIYKQKRYAEIKKLTEKSKFGSVYPISKTEYQEEITDASEDTFVFAHLSLSSKLQSRLLSDLFIQLANKFRELKFVEIPGARAIENYPESNCPTLLIYHKKQVIKQYITLVQLGGNATKLADLENVLVEIEAVKHSDERLLMNQEDDDLKEAYRLRFVKKSIRDSENKNNNDDDDDDDFFD
ncbi:Plp2 protein [Saccharomycopsis crataegensis]|uniref:Plp2 protein n=1 Tax=Saccharomycopsis crataegensis TaxID=43959 RepID=A0AAV5QF86_9ASCO|nr:Plp2 protein [Saccharomycopsis crataegensis]